MGFRCRVVVALKVLLGSYLGFLNVWKIWKSFSIMAIWEQEFYQQSFRV